MSPGQGKFPSLNGLILHKFNPSKKCFFCQTKVAIFLEGLAILPNFFWKDWQSFQTLKLREINHQRFDELFFGRIDNPSKIFWKDWFYHILVILTILYLHINILILFYDILVFSYILGMLMKSFGNFGTGKILYSSLKAHPNSCAHHNFSPFMA